jgi:hypothetical protein
VVAFGPQEVARASIGKNFTHAQLNFSNVKEGAEQFTFYQWNQAQFSKLSQLKVRPSGISRGLYTGMLPDAEFFTQKELVDLFTKTLQRKTGHEVAIEEKSTKTFTKTL